MNFSRAASAPEIMAGSGQDGRALLRRDLAAVVLVALAVRLAVGWDLTLHIYPDAVFQSLEPAHRLVFGYGYKTWEWQAGIRWWGWPGLLAGPMALGAAISDDPAVYLRVVRLFLILVSLAMPVSAWWFLSRIYPRDAALVGGLVVALWFEPAFYASSALSEAFATPLLVVFAALASALRLQDGGDTRFRLDTGRTMLALGVLAAAIFFLRFHLAPAVALLALVALWTDPWRRLRSFVWGAVPLGLVFAAIDWITWDYPLQSVIRNVRFNLFKDVAERFGTQPWYYYLHGLAWLWGPGLVLIFYAWRGSRHYIWFGVTAVLILVLHSLVGHKELRYAFPAHSLLLVAASVGIAYTIAAVTDPRRRRRASIACVAGFAVLSLAMGAARFYDPWHRIPKVLEWQLALHDEPGLCGLAMEESLLIESGGQAYLHRSVPLQVVPGEELDPQVNYAILSEGSDWSDRGFRLERCEGTLILGAPGEICLWRRPDVSC